MKNLQAQLAAFDDRAIGQGSSTGIERLAVQTTLAMIDCDDVIAAIGMADQRTRQAGLADAVLVVFDGKGAAEVRTAQDLQPADASRWNGIFR